MEILAKKGKLEEEKCDLLVVNLFEGVTEPHGGTGAINEAVEGFIEELFVDDKFKGKLCQIFTFRALEWIPAKRVLVVGLGKRDDFDEEAIRKATAVSINEAKKLKAKQVVSIFHGAGVGGIKPRFAAKAMTEGAMLADYNFNKYKSNGQEIKEFIICEKLQGKTNQAEKGIVDGKITAEAAIYARDLVNESSEEIKPSKLVECAREIAKESKGSIRARIYDKEKLEKMKANALLTIAKGSHEPPYLIHMIYKPEGKAKKKIALVGKGITFDCGGLCIKPAEAMFNMKCDMAGAATVLGIFKALAELQPKYEIHGIIGACENMPGGGAVKPGEVVKTMSGKTMEILHTDAEGRVTLADTLFYAGKQKPDMIIDYATLTGACMIALGEEIAAIMGTNEDLVQKIKESSELAGEKIWELPLYQPYDFMIKSKIADTKNTTPKKYGGAITAGLLLKEFVPKDVAWAHIDIAGPAFAEKKINEYTKEGGTGFAVRTTLEFLSH